VYTDDVGMPQYRREIGFPVEAGTILGIGRSIVGKRLQCVPARQPRMLGQVNLAHSARTQQAHNPEAREGLTVRQRHDD
jgi:hypothetical protein